MKSNTEVSSILPFKKQPLFSYRMIIIILLDERQYNRIREKID